VVPRLRPAPRLLLAAALALPPLAARADDPPDPQRGMRLWAKCRACHTIEPGGANKVGPNLAGLFGRPAAALADYDYSEAMRRSGIVWTEDTLDRFLAATQDYLPGTKMYGGLSAAADRRDLIAWLKRSTTP
jgi:cytochrome c